MMLSSGTRNRRRNVACQLPRPASDSSLIRSKHTASAPTLGLSCRPASASKEKGPPPPTGVSVAHMLWFLSEQKAPDDAPPERSSTRWAAQALRKGRQEEDLTGSVADDLLAEGATSFATGAVLAGAVRTHVAHAWDASLADLVDCLAKDSGGDLDRRYSLDVFTADLLAPPDDPPAAVHRTVAAAKEVLLVLDAEGVALKRLWVLFEALLAVAVDGKLRVRCSAPKGYGDSEEALRSWEARIDAVDWVLATATRKTDDKRLRNFAERNWEMNGKGVERMLAQLKKQLRKEVYGQILIGAVQKGNKAAVAACLDAGASPEQQDAFGNTVEELAAHHGRQDIEDFLFTKRMNGRPHTALSEFFSADALVEAAESGEVAQDALTPFLTQADGLDEEEFDEED